MTEDDVAKARSRRARHSRSVDQGSSDDETLVDGPDWATLAQSGMNDDGMSILNDAEDEAQQALVQLDRSHRTLREARAKQHYVKISRQYYRSSTRPTTRPRAQYSKEVRPAMSLVGHAVEITEHCSAQRSQLATPRLPQPKSKSQPHSSAIGPGASREPLS